MTTQRKTQSALRAALKQEDAALAGRLPESATTTARKAGTPKAAAPKAAAPKAAAPKAAAARPANAKAATAKAATAKAAAAGAAVSKPAVPTPPAAESAARSTRRPPAQVHAASTGATAPSKRLDEVWRNAAAAAEPASTAEHTASTGIAGVAAKGKREKVTRDSFSMPKSEHARLKQLRTALGKAGRPCTKSELLRAGLQLLAAYKVADTVALLDALPVRKGRGRKR